MEGAARVVSRALGSACLHAMVLVFASVLSAPAVAAPSLAVEPESKAGKAGKAVKAPRGAKVPVKGGPADGNALWWNDKELVKSLSLTDAQRKKMDGYLAAYRKNVPEETRRVAFHEALAQGHWDEGRAEIEKLARAADASVRTRGNLKLKILSTLTKEQHKKVVDGYPRLVYKPWGRAMRSPRR